jgi:hypothetical protein
MKHFSEEHRKNLSIARRKRCLSERAKQKLRLANLGKKLSEEHKKKLSLSHLGKKTMLGFKFSDESRLKMSLSHRRDKSWNFKNQPILKDEIRRSFKYRQWRSDVFTRDNFRCVKCNKGGKIEAHHCIKGFADILYENKIETLEQAEACEEFWNINNGITLCINCHSKIHENLSFRKLKHE